MGDYAYVQALFRPEKRSPGFWVIAKQAERLLKVKTYQEDRMAIFSSFPA